MAIVKTNNAGLDEIAADLAKAYDSLEKAEAVWGDNFDNLLNNIVTSGYLDSLYEDAKSNWHVWRGSITVVAAVAGFALCLTNPVGWVAIALAALGAIFGIGVGIKTISKEPDWYTVSKQVFEALLNNCTFGNDDCYLALCNTATALYNARLSLEKMKAKINEYQQLYADLNATANAMGVVTTLASDGTTVLSIDTEVTIDGQTIQLSTSEALNAFYTYENVVMAAEFEGEYLASLGYEVDFNAIVSNANSFMTNTISSGLYSHEFIEGILPNYTPDSDAATDVVVNALEMDASEVQSLLSSVSNLNIFQGLGLVGATMLAGAVTPKNDDPDLDDDDDDDPVQKPIKDDDPVVPPSGGGGGDDHDDPDDPDDPEEDDEQVDIELNELIELDIPDSIDELTIDGEDIDEMARELFFEKYQGADLTVRRQEDYDAFELLYNKDDKSELIALFEGIGYGAAEAVGLLTDKEVALQAYILNSQNKEMLEIANGLAADYGITDFKSSYAETPDYLDFVTGDGQAALTDYSNSKEVVEAKTVRNEAKEAYSKAITDANESISNANQAKSDLETLKAEIESTSGTDSSKWTAEQVEKYNEAVDAYNNAVQEANDKKALVDEAKETYNEALESYEAAKTEFINTIKKQVQEDNGSISSGENLIDSPGNSSNGGSTSGATFGGSSIDSSDVTSGNNNDSSDSDLINGFLDLAGK